MLRDIRCDETSSRNAKAIESDYIFRKFHKIGDHIQLLSDALIIIGDRGRVTNIYECVHVELPCVPSHINIHSAFVRFIALSRVRYRACKNPSIACSHPRISQTTLLSLTFPSLPRTHVYERSPSRKFSSTHSMTVVTRVFSLFPSPKIDRDNEPAVDGTLR